VYAGEITSPSQAGYGAANPRFAARGVLKAACGRLEERAVRAAYKRGPQKQPVRARLRGGIYLLPVGIVILFAVQEAVVFLIGDEVFGTVGETFGAEGGAVPGIGESADGGQGDEIIFGVLRGDLQTIEEESGAARIEFASRERFEDAGEGELDGGAVLNEGHGDGVALLAGLWAGVDGDGAGVQGLGLGLAAARLAAAAVVEEAPVALMKGGGAALLAIGLDVAAFLMHAVTPWYLPPPPYGVEVL
jgi:hypothetical protein